MSATLFETQLSLLVSYDRSLGLMLRIEAAGGRIFTAERQHKLGRWRLDVTVPAAVAHEFQPYIEP
ncbi:MAG TPA: hypothetical protein PLX89_07675 [Verrucomicrobiota bacterium]|nr:hypothetical protein [Verrucomicrobiales bacterium]HRI12868.1 hypothetical protein [Verrucomicrobiota bacterium]